MSFEGVTDTEIQRLITMPKTSRNAARVKVKGHPHTQHEDWTVDLEGEDGAAFSFYTRQNKLLERDFSCGLIWKSHEGDLPLLRLNGSGHPHPPLMFECHIHKASERALRAGMKPDAFAEPTEAYDSLVGAKHQLVAMASISGVHAPAPHPKLL